MWHTLSSAEWSYIFNTRSGSTVGGTENARYVKAQVNGKNGVILFPDEYSHPSYLPAPLQINIQDAGFAVNSFSGEGWTAMENLGCVFLPAAGCRYGSSTLEVYANGSGGSQSCGTYGMYWSNQHAEATTNYTKSEYALHVCFYSSYLGVTCRKYIRGSGN